jgi:hypothetical protein
MALVAQVSYITTHRVAVNTGFNIAYNLPSNLREFTSPIFFPRSLLNKNSSILPSFLSKLAEDSSMDETSTDATEEDTTIVPRTKRDITAGEFYLRINEVLSL